MIHVSYDDKKALSMFRQARTMFPQYQLAAVEDWAIQVIELARQNAPWRTGRLYRSGYAGRDGRSVDMGFSVRYADKVESRHITHAGYFQRARDALESKRLDMIRNSFRRRRKARDLSRRATGVPARPTDFGG